MEFVFRTSESHVEDRVHPELFEHALTNSESRQLMNQGSLEPPVCVESNIETFDPYWEDRENTLMVPSSDDVTNFQVQDISAA